MGKLFEKPIKKENRLLNIFICNLNMQIQRMKYLDINANTDPLEYTHKFYGWKFYDFGAVLNENTRNNILNQLIEFSSNKNKFQNVLVIHDYIPNNIHNTSLLLFKQIIRNSSRILFQPLIIFVSNSIQKDTSYCRNILKDFNLEENIEGLFYMMLMKI